VGGWKTVCIYQFTIRHTIRNSNRGYGGQQQEGPKEHDQSIITTAKVAQMKQDSKIAAERFKDYQQGKTLWPAAAEATSQAVYPIVGYKEQASPLPNALATKLASDVMNTVFPVASPFSVSFDTKQTAMWPSDPINTLHAAIATITLESDRAFEKAGARITLQAAILDFLVLGSSLLKINKKDGSIERITPSEFGWNRSRTDIIVRSIISIYDAKQSLLKTMTEAEADNALRRADGPVESMEMLYLYEAHTGTPNGKQTIVEQTLSTGLVLTSMTMGNNFRELYPILNSTREHPEAYPPSFVSMNIEALKDMHKAQAKYDNARDKAVFTIYAADTNSEEALAGFTNIADMQDGDIIASENGIVALNPAMNANLLTVLQEDLSIRKRALASIFGDVDAAVGDRRQITAFELAERKAEMLNKHSNLYGLISTQLAPPVLDLVKETLGWNDFVAESITKEFGDAFDEDYLVEVDIQALASSDIGKVERSVANLGQLVSITGGNGIDPIALAKHLQALLGLPASLIAEPQPTAPPLTNGETL